MMNQIRQLQVNALPFEIRLDNESLGQTAASWAASILRDVFAK
jgi:hypothetical protein